jgi:hypothetical protein
MSDNRQNSTFTMDRFDFDKGLTTIRYLDGFFRQSSYADTVLGLGASAGAAFEGSNGNNNNNISNVGRDEMST